MSDKISDPLLIVEDSDDDFNALHRLMQRLPVENPIYRCVDGDQALDFLSRSGDYAAESTPRPSVILLDLNLPGTDGREVLAQLKQDETLREIPVVVLTTSANPIDIEYCYQQGANGYLIKPMNIQDFQELVRSFVDFWLKANTGPQIV
jgi:CheY-like chemotaxis protein